LIEETLNLFASEKSLRRGNGVALIDKTDKRMGTPTIAPASKSNTRHRPLTQKTHDVIRNAFDVVGLSDHRSRNFFPNGS
jgi:hypothetical protein